MKKITRIASAAALSAMMTVSAFAAVPASADWEKNGSSYSYTDENGEKVTGWQTIGKYKYYFDKNGKSASGFKKIGGKYYYFDASKKGRMATGWMTIKGEKYYFGKDGVMCADKWKTIGGNKYYFKSSGKMATGTVKIDGKSYKFGSDGVYQGKASTKKSSSSDIMAGLTWKSSYSQAKKALSSDNAVAINMEFQGIKLLMSAEPTEYMGITVSARACLFDSDGKMQGFMVMGSGIKSDLEKIVAKAYPNAQKQTDPSSGMVMYITEKEIAGVASREQNGRMIDVMIIINLEDIDEMGDSVSDFASALIG